MLKSSVFSMLQAIWRWLKDYAYRNDLVLLLINPDFIPKKLLRDALKREAAHCDGRLMVDAGCGWQPYRMYFEQVKYYVGLDLSAYRKPNVIASVDHLPVRTASADIVLSTEVIEHTQEPKVVCHELARVLREGGTLLLSAPMSWNLHYQPYDYYRFTRYGLVYLLEEAGLEIVRVTRIGGLVSLIGARLTDIIQSKVQRLSLLKRVRARSVLSALVVSPLNASFFLLGRALDSLDETDAIGWLVVARKPSDSPERSEANCEQ